MNELTETIKYELIEPKNSVYSDINLYNECMKMAQSLSKTDLVPSNYRGKPENCLIAIDVARQVGAKSPLFVMQNLYVVNGKPSWSGQYTAATVHRYFCDVKIEWQKENEVKTGCRVVAKDKNNNICEGSWITLKMAKEEGWIDKRESKWKTMPEQMLQYRAFAFFARIYCPDKLMGLHDEFENKDINDRVSSIVQSKEQANEITQKLKSKAKNEEIIESEIIINNEEVKQEYINCEICGKVLTEKELKYSNEFCYNCQKKNK